MIALAVSGGLRPAQTTNDGSILFESANGVVLRYAGLKALDASGRTVPSRLEVRGSEIRLIVEDQGAQYPLVVDPLWTQQQKLTSSDGTLGDWFGYSVSVSGDTAVIGTVGGTAYVFVNSDGAWSLQAKLTASDGAPGDYFGSAVSVSGDTAVIGASLKNRTQGAVYVFVRSGGVWSQQQELTASDGLALDWFGYSVSASGDTAVIGASRKNNETGAAYVFVRSGGTWSQQQELTASDGVAGDWFGDSVSVSGNTAVIGAWAKNEYHGAAYVFTRSGASWGQPQELLPSDGAASEGFGVSVSVDGDTALIGAFGQNGTGAAYLFLPSNGTWAQHQILTASDGVIGDSFGSSVSVSGDTALIGADGKNNQQGAAYIFVRSGSTWAQQQELAASDGAAEDQFGFSGSVNGDKAVVGAFFATINSSPCHRAAGVRSGSRKPHHDHPERYDIAGQHG